MTYNVNPVTFLRDMIGLLGGVNTFTHQLKMKASRRLSMYKQTMVLNVHYARELCSHVTTLYSSIPHRNWPHHKENCSTKRILYPFSCCRPACYECIFTILFFCLVTQTQCRRCPCLVSGVEQWSSHPEIFIVIYYWNCWPILDPRLRDAGTIIMLQPSYSPCLFSL